MKNKVNPYPPIGPVTKKESKAKTVPPFSASKSAEVKSARKKQIMKNAASIGSAIVGTIGMIAADARLARGKNRYEDRNPGINSPDPTMKQKWNLGKNKKSTKK